MWKKSFPVAVLIFWSLLAAKAYPCQCNFRAHRKDFRGANAIFVGKVVKVDKINRVSERWESELAGGSLGNAVTFQIDKRWKGTKAKQIVVLEYYEAGCAGFRFREDETYLIYAFERELIAFTACSRTRRFNQERYKSAEEIRQLDNRWFRLWARINPF